jgi:Fur family ferric uptake transcriptional regulator
MTDMGGVFQKLQEGRYKLTNQRKIVLQVFLDHQNEHLSAEDVHQIVKRQSSDNIGLATVYRSLELLTELEVLQKMDFGDGRSRYEFIEADTPHHHHHLICLGCGIVIEFEEDLLESLETTIFKNSNFTIVDHEVKFYGYCQECQKNREG